VKCPTSRETDAAYEPLPASVSAPLHGSHAPRIHSYSPEIEIATFDLMHVPVTHRGP
jgi:hypothetical protein